MDRGPIAEVKQGGWTQRRRLRKGLGMLHDASGCDGIVSEDLVIDVLLLASLGASDAGLLHAGDPIEDNRNLSCA